MKAMWVKVFTLAGLGSVLAGCVNPDGCPNNTASGALIGGATGATIGALADHRNPGAGALIGGAAGLVVGGLVGLGVDQENEARRQYYSSPPVYASVPPPKPMSIPDVKAMSKAGVNEDAIISQISNTRSVFQLDADAIIDLKNSGVSQKVISSMVNSSNSVATQPPPAPQVQTVLVAPGPGYVWVNGEWMWNGAGWVWVSGRWVSMPHVHAIWVDSRWEYGPQGWHRIPGYWR